MADFRVSVFADQQVGLQSLEFLLQYFPQDVLSVVTTGKYPAIEKLLNHHQFPENKRFLAKTKEQKPLLDFLKQNSPPDWIILAWWPFLIKKETIAWPTKACMNFHPSLLPHNRGKHYNFWTIVEESPFGVSLHKVTEGIDDGDILFQKTIEKDWTDTGASLYHKAQSAMLELFKESYPKLRQGQFQAKPQPTGEGSFRWGYEMEKHSTIDLEKTYNARDFLNLLRARTFAPHPGIRFQDQGKWYHIRVSIEPTEPPEHNQ